MGKLIYLLEDSLLKIKNENSLFLNETFVIYIFNYLKNELPLFQKYMQYIPTKSNKVLF